MNRYDDPDILSLLDRWERARLHPVWRRLLLYVPMPVAAVVSFLMFTNGFGGWDGIPLFAAIAWQLIITYEIGEARASYRYWEGFRKGAMESSTESDGSDVVFLIDRRPDGEDVPFMRIAARLDDGTVAGWAYRDMDGEPYEPTGIVISPDDDLPR